MRAPAAGGTGTGELLAEAPLSPGTGVALPEGVRHFFEEQFGHDFSAVRVHATAEAEATAMALSARAFTVGSHIVFGRDEFAPGTATGRRLLAHELTHVIQQRAAGGASRGEGVDRAPFDAGSSSDVSRWAELPVSQPGDLYEQEADRVADQFMRGALVTTASDGAAGPATSVTSRSMVHRDGPAQDQCGAVRNIAFTYRVAIQENRFADANAIVAGATADDAKYLRCRLSSPNDSVAMFVKAQLSAEDMAGVVGRLDAKLKPATPAADPPAASAFIEDRPDYLEKAIASVGIIVGDQVYLTTRDGRVIPLSLKNVFTTPPGDNPVRLMGLSASEAEAHQAVKASGLPSAVAYYRAPESGIILPTTITSSTAPQLTKLVNYKARWEGLARTSQLSIGVLQIAEGMISFNQLNQAVLAQIASKSGLPAVNALVTLGCAGTSGTSGFSALRVGVVEPPPPPPVFSPRLNSLDPTLGVEVFPFSPSNVTRLPVRTQTQVPAAFSGANAFQLAIQSDLAYLPTPAQPALNLNPLNLPAGNTNAIAPGAPSFFFIPSSGLPVPINLPGFVPPLVTPEGMGKSWDKKARKAAAKAVPPPDETAPDTGEKAQTRDPCINSPFARCPEDEKIPDLASAKTEIDKRYDEAYGKLPADQRPPMVPQDMSVDYLLDGNVTQKLDKHTVRGLGFLHRTFGLAGKSGHHSVIGSIVCIPCCDGETGDVVVRCTVK